MNVSIVIPNYNGYLLLKKNLPKVLDTVGASEVIIVDDCSTDKSVELLKQFAVKVLVNEKNLGFSSTVNKGVEEAKGEIVVLLNTDVVPEKNFLKPLINHFNDPKVFAVGCLDKSIEGEKIVLRGRGLGRFERGFVLHQRGEVDKTDTFWVAGGSGAFRKSAWEKLGGFDTLYDPFYWEDIDLSYRAVKSGYNILFEPQSMVTHEHTEGAIKKNYSDSKVKIISYRNQFIFVWKNITDLDKQILHFLWLPYHFISAILGGEFYFFAGFFLALLKFPRVIAGSYKVQKQFIKTDKEIIG